jgi:hypothetical protein
MVTIEMPVEVEEEEREFPEGEEGCWVWFPGR